MSSEELYYLRYEYYFTQNIYIWFSVMNMYILGVKGKWTEKLF